ncbi:MAG: ATP-binding protein [Verrucomicrobiota bacterium]
MKFFHSIRWHLQLWHGVLLVWVLAGFGFTAWQLQRSSQLQRVDQDLERRVAVVAGAIHGSTTPPPRPPQNPPQDRPQDPPKDRPQDPPKDRPQDRPQDRERPRERPQEARPPPVAGSELRLAVHDENLFEEAAGGGFYYAAWLPDGREISRSATAPAEVPYPPLGDEPSTARLRGNLREYVRFMATGECILVGRDIRDEVAASRRFAWILGAAGGGVLLLGLAGGGWVSSRALRPLADISTAAAKIAAGDLSQRIDTPDRRSELGTLAQVLNDTFTRLQASFIRQAQFTADASHELRTPIAVVLTQTQSALSRERSAEEYRDSLAACQRAAQRMRRLVDSLLTLARCDSGEAATDHQPCELDRIVREAIELLRPLAEQQQVRIEADLKTTRCIGHPEQLGQVVTNLVSNAISHNRPGGSVQVAVGAAADAIHLCVSDDGEGIAEQDIPHIFERFYRADQARSGNHGHSGLGLAITQAIIAAHCGTIAVDSVPGSGSSFTVHLPLPPTPSAEEC